jgi:hypothetical protein
MASTQSAGWVPISAQLRFVCLYRDLMPAFVRRATDDHVEDQRAATAGSD